MGKGFKILSDEFKRRSKKAFKPTQLEKKKFKTFKKKSPKRIQEFSSDIDFGRAVGLPSRKKKQERKEQLFKVKKTKKGFVLVKA